MADQQVTLRTRKFIRNPLLSRRQMVLYVGSMVFRICVMQRK
jgi:ribosomal protein S24E